jgi:YVTN family beta-propeller protein
MAELPSGVVTFLFTDIEGSTRHVKHFRERWDEVLAEHQRMLRAAFARHGGSEVDTQGDSFFVVFSSARDAVLAAVEAQRALLGYVWPDEAELRVRMGIHTGQAVVTDDRFTGLAVHRAARIGAAGHGGQVLVSQATQTLLEDEEEDLGLVLQDLGEQRLKDLERPVRLYQVGAEGLPGQFPPLRHEAALAQAAELALAPRRFGRHRFLIAAAAFVAVAAVAMTTVLLAGDDAAVTVRPNSVGVIDPKKNAVVDQLAVGARPGPLTAGGGAVWVANLEDRTLARIDPRGRSVVRYISLQRTPTGLAYGEGAVWVANGLLGTVQRIDPQFDTPGDPIETGVGRSDTASVAVGFGSVWFAAGNSNVVRLDPASGHVAARLFSGLAPAAVAVDGDSVWVANRGSNDVWRFSPSTNQRVKVITVSRQPTAIAIGAGAVWVADAGSDAVTRIDQGPLSGSTVTIPVGRQPSAIAYGAGSVWVANRDDATILRIDPATNDVTATIKVGNVPEGIFVYDNLVWVAVQAD